MLNQAAWGSVLRSIEMPLFYCANNIMGTLNMLEACPIVRLFVIMSKNGTENRPLSHFGYFEDEHDE